MKKILTLAIFAGIGLTGCHHNPNWHYDCERNYSHDAAENSECKAKVAQMANNPQQTPYNTPGVVGLRADISGPRSDEEIGHRTQDDL